MPKSPRFKTANYETKKSTPSGKSETLRRKTARQMKYSAGAK